MGEIRIDFHLRHPVELVWQALTEPALLTAWFMPVYEELRPGARIRLDPGDLGGFDSVVDAYVTEADDLRTLVMRWRAAHLHTVVAWRLAPVADGCRLTVTQQGFLGPAGTRRESALRATYTLLFGRRLPAVLDGLAAGGPLPALVRGAAPRPEPAATPAARPRSRGVRAGAVTALVAAVAGAVLGGALFTRDVEPATAWATSPPATLAVSPSAEPTPIWTAVGDPVPLREPVPGAARSAATTRSASPRPKPSRSPSPSAARRSAPLTADYVYVRPVLLGYTGEITVRNPGEETAASWTVTITLPPLAVVSRADVGFTRSGTTVTFRGEPLEAGASARFAFTVRLDVSGLVGATAPVSCRIGAAPCGGL